MKIVKAVFLSFIFLFVTDMLFAEYDREYIKKYEGSFMVKPFLSRAFTSLSYKKKDADDHLSYIPNNPFSFGLAVSWRNLEVSYAFGLYFMKEEDRVDTDEQDFQMYYHGKKIILGGVYQKYGGFYLDEGSESDRPDIKVQRVILTADYVFNDNFSSRAAFDQSEKQIKNAGSFLLGGGIYYNKIEADYPLDDESSVYAPQEYEIWQFGPSAGYAYTWVFKDNYFVTGAMTMGISATFSTVNGEKQDFKVFPSVSPKIAAGYNKDNWGVNITFLANLNFIAEIGDDDLTLGNGKFFLNYIRRFNFSKISEKSGTHDKNSESK